jgi:hypothetical protein
MTNRAKVITSVVVSIILFIGITTILDIDLIRWFTCNSVFAAPQDRNSDVCKHLDDAP